MPVLRLWKGGAFGFLFDLTSAHGIAANPARFFLRLKRETTPGPLPWVSDQFSFHWIHMHVLELLDRFCLTPEVEIVETVLPRPRKRLKRAVSEKATHRELALSYDAGRVSEPRAGHMRNVIFAINITLDGCCDHTKGFVDEETLEYFTHLTREVDLQVFGRKTYQLMVPYWPEVLKDPSATKAHTEFARAFDSINKIVFSRSLDTAEAGNTRIVRTNLRDEIVKLKQEPGRNILVGGVSVPSQLIELGLVDEFRFVVGPIVVGEGRRLLDAVSLRERLQLKLAESKIFKSGCVALRYLKQ